MTDKDTSVVGKHTTKRKLATEAEANGIFQEELSQSKPKHKDADDEDNDDCPAKMGSEKPKKKPSPVKKLKGKPTTSSAVKAVKEKSLTPTSAEPLDVEQVAEARIDALLQLDRMLTIPKPPEIQILLLENMSEADVLATFDGYRGDFDKLFQERENEERTDCYMNVGHMDVMDVLNKDIRWKMMRKLSQSYYFRGSHTSLIINGLLPLWIVLLFTDTYNLSHDDAVRQIKEQLEWSNYQKALNDDPLDPDLDLCVELCITLYK